MNVPHERSGAADGSAHGRFLNIHMEEIKKEPEIGGFSGTLAQVDGLIRCMDGVDFVTADRFQEHVHTEGRRQLTIRGEAVRHAGQAVLIVAVPAPDETDVRHGPKHGALFQMVLRALEQFGQPSGIIQIQAVGHEIALRGKHGSPQSVAIQRCFGGAGIRALRIGEKHIDAVIAEPGEERTARLQIAREHDLRHGARRGGDGNTDIHNNLTVPVRSGRLSWIGSCRWRQEWPLPPFPADRKR